ncbi:DNA adenine methylase [Tissierella sp. Yu-01]|uniref:DNA adenine methylase n=1 Tax=Tissierella sp. Yu-01 TaxID=3035694 RepID=UPI00240CFC14|nr:DNA adenine methylase [Tissierella sp. Yu-01]WFA10068.1 DNA adenine methylase [Tissierella sp. Yu-01]
MTKNILIQPFLKWAGGKRQLLKEIEKYTPKQLTGTYYEPFLGGGAVLFNLQPKKAIVNDFNTELINAYKVVRDNVDELIEDLSIHKNTADYFYNIRSLDRGPDFENLSKVQRASRLIYLNKTCYNGLFRVNSNNEFNTPFGNYKNPNIVNEPVLRAVSNYLNSADITFLNGDFEDAVKGIRKGAFVYFDPPYMPISSSSSFTGYTLDGFNQDDQTRLRNLCIKLKERGIKFLLSNSTAPYILELYKDEKLFKIEYVGAKRAINSVGRSRGEIKEVLVRGND